MPAGTNWYIYLAAMAPPLSPILGFEHNTFPGAVGDVRTSNSFHNDWVIFPYSRVSVPSSEGVRERKRKFGMREWGVGMGHTDASQMAQRWHQAD